MTRLALYREERPRTFAEVVGQRHVSRTLKNALALGRLTHAYLFAGPRGTGKTSVARILAKVVNCQEPRDGEPCNTCPACQVISSGQSMDIIEIDAASNRGIDEIRDLRDKVKYAPTDLKKKVYIIDEVHMLTEPAFNALLKTLEEPPGHVMFILATTEAHKVPVTIRSRCQRHDFHRLGTAEIIQRLKDVCGRHQFQVQDDALAAVARQAEGGMRDALSLLDQLTAYAEEGRPVSLADTLAVLGAAPLDVFVALDGALLNANPGEALLILDEQMRQGKDLRQLARDYVGHLRDLLMLKVSGGPGLVELPEATLRVLREQAEKFSLEQLMGAVKTLAALDGELRYATSPRLLVEVALIRLTVPAAVPQPGTPAAAASGLDLGPGPGARAPAAAGRPSPARAAAAEPALPGGDGPELEQVKQAWPQVLELFRRKDSWKPFVVQLQQGFPHRVDGKVLTIGFREQTARDLVARKEHPDNWIAKALEKVNLPGYQVKLVVVQDGGDKQSTAAGGGPADVVNVLKQRLGPEVPVELKEDER